MPSGSAAGPLPDLLDHDISFDDRVLADALLNIYHRNFDIAHEIEPNIFQATRNIFDNAAAEGIATVPSGSAAGSDAFLNALRHNIDVFSAFRTHKMQNDIAAQLLTSDGKLKPFSKFVRDVSPYIDHKNRLWLQTEYNTAVLRAHQAARWQQFIDEKDVYPNLKWLPSTSPDPGADHKIFWNIVRPVNDPFWDVHRPGDRWNCKCDLVQSDDPVTPLPDATVPASSAGGSEPSPGLENNPAKDKQLFSDKHPYFPKSCSSCPLSKNKLAALVHNLTSNSNCYKCPYADSLCKSALNPKRTEVQIYKTDKGCVSSYVLETDKPDYPNVLQVAKLFADKGSNVVMTPRFSCTVNCPEYDRIYKSLLKTKYKGLCPDLLIDGKWYEHEGFVTDNKKNALKHMLKHGLQQANRIVIEDCGLPDWFVKKSIYNRLRNGIDIEEVWIHNSNSVRLIYKKAEG